MLALTVPTIFTAQDKLTPFFTKSSKNLTTFAEKAETMAARSNRAFNKLTPTLSETGKKLLETAEDAIGAAALVGGIMFSGKSLMDYDNAIASLHGHLANLSDQGFSKFQQKVNQVANDTRMSSIDVAGAFEKITTLNKKFAATADSLGEVAKGSILLSKINKTDLATSADGLVGVMNLYNLAADQSNRTVNVLAASESKHASSIADTMAGLTAFGPIAKHYNVGLEQSVGLLDLLAENQVKGDVAGTRLSQTILKLQAAHAGYKNGVFSLSGALEQVHDRLMKLTAGKERDNLISSLFGKRQQATGILLLDNIDKIKQYTQSVTGSTEAERLAGIQENTLSGFVERLKNQWINLITRQDRASWGMNILKKTIGFITDHLGTLVTIGAGVLAFFALWKIRLIATNVYLGINNWLLARNAALTATAAAETAAQTVVVGGFGTMLSGVTTELGLADAAATTFFGTLSAFALPAALVALSGMALYKAFQSESDRADARKFSTDLQNNKAENDAWMNYQNKLPGAPSMADASAFQAAWATQQKFPNGFNVKIPSSLNDAANKGAATRDYGLEKVPVYGMPELRRTSDGKDILNQNSNISITLHDPGNTVKDVKTTGALPINVKVSKTQGQK